MFQVGREHVEGVADTFFVQLTGSAIGQREFAFDRLSALSKADARNRARSQFVCDTAVAAVARDCATGPFLIARLTSASRTLAALMSRILPRLIVESL